jgi:hypothetical protein
MAWYPIGPSSYPDLFGQMQYVNSPTIAAQWLSLTRDFAVKFGASGDRLAPNEGRRTRPRQQLLYQNYLRTGYPIAAYPYSSRHDEFTHGNAIDAGVTMANGSNRALTGEEFAWLHEQCELRGFTWTGRLFATPEPWHIEGDTRPPHFPPYPDITVENAIIHEEEEDMTPQQAQQLADVARAVSSLQSDMKFVKSELLGSDPKQTRLQEAVIILRALSAGDSRLKEAVLLLRQLVSKGK